MADIRLQLALFNDTPFTGSVRLVPANVTLSGSKVFTLDWIESDTDFIFENVAPGLYELTASSAIKETPLFCINVPTGSGLFDAADLEFPLTERSLTWLPEFAVSASWASSSISASYIKTAQSASYVLGSNVKGTVLSASHALQSSNSDNLGGQSKEFYQNASNLTSGSLPVGRLSGTYFITASSAQSASYAILAASASHSVTASYVQNAVSASYAPIPPLVPSASVAVSASYAPQWSISSGSAWNITSSHALTASVALNVIPTVSASWASASLSASVAVSASYAPSNFTISSGSAWNITSSHANTASVSLSAYSASSAVSASFAISASHSQTASFALNAPPSISSSYASSSLSSSYALSASYAPQWSIASGSSWNITSSVSVSSSIAAQSLTASFVTASNVRGTVTSASFAASASYAPFTTVSSVPSASWASSSLSASYAPNTFTINSGSTWNITSSRAVNSLTASHVPEGIEIVSASLFSPALSDVSISGITANRALYVDQYEVLKASPATLTELGYITGLSSSAQAQLDSKQPRIGTGSFLPISSSQSISASYAPHNPVVDGLFTVTTGSNVATITLEGRNFGGQAVDISSTPAGLTLGSSVYVSGDIHATEFIGLMRSASIASTASMAIVANTASYLRDGAIISGSVLKWTDTTISANGPNGIAVHDAYTGNDALWTYDDTVTLRNVAVVDTTAGKVVITNAEGRLTTGVVTSDQLANLSGSSSNLQAQIDGKQAQLLTGSVYPITASFALSASWFVSSSHAGTASIANTASYAVTASSAVSASYSLSSSFSRSGSYALTASLALSASYVSASHSSSFATTASYAITASHLPGLTYDSASYFLNVTGSNLIVMQRVTGSFNAATFEYVGLSGSAVSRGTIQAAWATGNSSSFTWTPYGCLDVGTVDLVMSTVLGGNSVQLRAFAPTYKNWIIKAWALYI